MYEITHVLYRYKTLKRDEENIKVYTREFEPKYLTSLKRSCKRRVADHLVANQALQLSDYLEWVQRNVTWENDMVMRYLHSSTAPKARDCVWKQMLLKPQNRIFSMSCPSVLSLFQDMNIKTLNLLYVVHLKAELDSGDFLINQKGLVGKMCDSFNKVMSSIFTSTKNEETKEDETKDLRKPKCAKGHDIHCLGNTKYRSFSCDKCHTNGNGLRWHCAECHYDVCFKCLPQFPDGRVRTRIDDSIVRIVRAWHITQLTCSYHKANICSNNKKISSNNLKIFSSNTSKNTGTKSPSRR